MGNWPAAATVISGLTRTTALVTMWCGDSWSVCHWLSQIMDPSASCLKMCVGPSKQMHKRPLLSRMLRPDPRSGSRKTCFFSLADHMWCVLTGVGMDLGPNRNCNCLVWLSKKHGPGLKRLFLAKWLFLGAVSFLLSSTESCHTITVPLQMIGTGSTSDVAPSTSMNSGQWTLLEKIVHRNCHEHVR